jgi:hypothetical protein
VRVRTIPGGAWCDGLWRDGDAGRFEARQRTDADAFLADFRALAIKTNGKVILMPAKPWFNDAGGGYSPAAQVDVDGTNVNLDFHDGSDTNDRTAWPKGAERRDWPFLILIRIFDRYQGDGGGCHQ